MDRVWTSRLKPTANHCTALDNLDLIKHNPNLIPHIIWIVQQFCLYRLMLNAGKERTGPRGAGDHNCGDNQFPSARICRRSFNGHPATALAWCYWPWPAVDWVDGFSLALRVLIQDTGVSLSTWHSVIQPLVLTWHLSPCHRGKCARCVQIFMSYIPEILSSSELWGGYIGRKVAEVVITRYFLDFSLLVLSRLNKWLSISKIICVFWKVWKI